MQEHCHRCGGDLPRGDEVTPFCPHCGSPQLYLQEYDRPILAPDADSSETTGAPPPPHPQLIEWKTAIRCAALVAGIASVLSLVATRVPLVSPLSTLTILTASILTLTLYQRRRPRARMNASVGARIGLIVGISLVVCLAISMAIAGLIARFSLHSMAAFDAELAQQMRTQIEHAAAANPTSPELLHYFLTPEFRAGMMLTGIAMLALLLLFLSTVGGAVGGLFRTRRTPAA
ncbi:hypothetical protein [Granulicella sp. dw_53]|uniref:hypothetical protein n=1 Tax=Granulicella sp. dw_53 TaxID=2719792 RepID=UPI001BD36855|nr:hypothetical protein [Granulicella sp. dw_53]